MRQARLRALKDSDTDAYMAHLSSNKIGSLLRIMETTHRFMARVGAVLDSKSSMDTITSTNDGGQKSAADAVLEAHGSKLNSESEELRKFKAYVASTKDEFKLVHKTHKFVQQQPAGLQAALFPHQLVGLRFLVSLHANNINGILADEMGVGKTIQTLAFLLHLKEVEGIKGPHMVLAPLSIIREWREACEQFVPTSLRVCELLQLEDASRDLCGPDPLYDLVLVPIHRVRALSKDMMERVPWYFIVVDEAHKAVSNLNTLTAQAISAIRFKHRLILTGTPLNSDLQELWSLLNFINADIFTAQDSFEEVFRRPFQRPAIADTTSRGGRGGGLSKAEIEAAKELENDSQLTEEEKQLLIMRMHQILRPFMLRRTKKDIDSSLKITFHEIMCPLSSVQQYLLKTLRAHRRLPHIADGATACYKSVTTITSSAQGICNHPFMLPFFASMMEREQRRQISERVEVVKDVRREEQARQEAAEELIRKAKEAEERKALLKLRAQERHLAKKAEKAAAAKAANGDSDVAVEEAAVDDNGDGTDVPLNTSRTTTTTATTTATNATAEEEAVPEATTSQPEVTPTQGGAEVQVAAAGEPSEEADPQALPDHIEIEDKPVVVAETPEAAAKRQAKEAMQAIRDKEATAIAEIEDEVEDKIGELADNIALHASGKFIVLDMMLRRMQQVQKKCVLFTHWLDCVDLLVEYFHSQGWSDKFVVLTGATSADERKECVQKFRSDPEVFIFLVSMKAGGCGLNLQIANIVILLDKDYTATNEDQAIARVFRIGQRNTVKAIYLTTDDPAEQRITVISDLKNKPRQAIIEGGGYHDEAAAKDESEQIAALQSSLASGAGTKIDLRNTNTMYFNADGEGEPSLEEGVDSQAALLKQTMHIFDHLLVAESDVVSPPSADGEVAEPLTSASPTPQYTVDNCPTLLQLQNSNTCFRPLYRSKATITAASTTTVTTAEEKKASIINTTRSSLEDELGTDVPGILIDTLLECATNEDDASQYGRGKRVREEADYEMPPDSYIDKYYDMGMDEEAIIEQYQEEKARKDKAKAEKAQQALLLLQLKKKAEEEAAEAEAQRIKAAAEEQQALKKKGPGRPKKAQK